MPEITCHFRESNSTSSNVNAIMAKPFGEALSFCLLIFGTDNRYSSEDVSNRWKFIIDQLGQLGIMEVSVSSDSDTKYNKAMRKMSLLGQESFLFAGTYWFSYGNETNEKKIFPVFVQDSTHIGTKMRNL